MEIWNHILYLAIVVVLLPCTATCCNGVSPKLGNMSSDNEITVGSSLTVRCTLFSNVMNSSGIEYYVTSENLMIKSNNIFLQNLDIVDDYTVEYTKENATVDDTGIYNCFLSIPEPDDSRFICTTHVAVGYLPLPVQNFSCISLSYESLNCSWVKPFNPVKTDYILTEYLRNNKNFIRKCPIASSSSCIFRLDTIPPYLKSSKTISLILTGNNSLGENKQYIQIDHFKIVKPSNPKFMTFANVTINSVFVQWHPPRGMEYNDFPPGLDYWLHYCPLNGNCTELCGVKKTKNSTSILVTGLVPFTDYKFMLRCRSSVATDNDMWSPFLNSSVRTNPDIPYLAPETISSSFEVQNIQKNRTINLYWKAIPSCYQNGGGFEYIIRFHNHYVQPRIKRDNSQVEVGNKTSYSFVHMDPNSAYLFRIYAKNSVGISDNSSIIIVDKAESLTKEPTDISVLSYGDGKYNISWHMNGQASARNYTLFWCENIKPRPFRCEGPLSWKTVDGTSQELQLLDSMTNFQFAVAANSDYSTSGLKWASCIVPVRGVLYKVNDVILSRKNSTSIQVNWMLDCNAQKSVVKEYAVSYCPVQADLKCPGKMNVVHINNPLSEQYIVNDLQPFTTYQFMVAARTEDGWSGNSWVKYETTMSAAPSDSPHDVHLLSVNGTIIKVSFRPPKHPNGIITKYRVLYASTTASPSSMGKIDYSVTNKSQIYISEINHAGMFLYTNYSIQVEACVGSETKCSEPSSPLYAFTGIGAPGQLNYPNAALINSSTVNISWSRPYIANGPIDMYQLAMVWQDYDEYEFSGTDGQMKVFNISGHQTYLILSVDCPQQMKDGVTYFFQIRAVNIKDNSPLYGNLSEPASTQLCYVATSAMSYRLLIGLIIGIAFGLAALVLAVYALAKWMKNKVEMVKDITVVLPSGLDSPIENPLNTYENFKKGLHQKNTESGISSVKIYGRFTSYASDKITKDLASSLDAVSEEFLISRRGREKSARNQSGDSSVSGKGHDSISSSATNKTHLSIDSGAEMDMPPSPDGMFSDTSSSNTTPRSYKPDLEIVEESNASSSKDSGLEKEGFSHVLPLANGTNVEPSARFPYYIRKKGHPYFNGQSFKRSEQMQPYSKFAIIAPVFTPNYISVGVHNAQLLQQQSLANSEPSVAEFQDDSDSEPLMVSGVPPYCRFGLARSAGNGLNITNQSLPVQENLGYSKFGIIYSAIGKPSSSNNTCAPNYSRVGYSKVIPNFNNNLVFLKRPLISNKQPLSSVEEKPSPTSTIAKSFDDYMTALKFDQDMPLDVTKANKNGGLVQPPSKPAISNGYVSFNHALSDACSPNVQLGSSSSNHCSKQNNLCNGGIEPFKTRSANGPSKILDLQPPSSVHSKPSSYVSFQEAKVMSQHDPSSECGNVSAVECGLAYPSTNSVGSDFAQSLDEKLKISQESLAHLFQPQLPNQDPENKTVPSTAAGSSMVKNGYLLEPEMPSNHDSLLLSCEPLEFCTSENLSGELAASFGKSNTLKDVVGHPDELLSCSPTTDSPLQPVINKPQSVSNGYVTWSELLEPKAADVSMLPNSTNIPSIEHV